MSVDRGEREKRILALLGRDGSLSVKALSHDLGVSEVTVRSQLSEMEERGLLTRTHGGAQANTMRSVLERAHQHPQAKERIARAAASLVHDDDRIMIEAGTTTAQVVRFLTAVHGVQIVTNSLLVLTYARQVPGLSITLTGGEFDTESESMVGPMALQAIRAFNVRLAFVGTDGFTVDRGMTTGYSAGAEALKAMSERAEETWLLSDSSKYGRAGFVGVMPLSELAGIITDDGLDDSAAAALEEIGCRLMIAR
ncbi:MAG: DeoR/GlpR transcriptional regulator [Propionibacteriaceae bacterium]|nr:DeoR/GlpR transcriptional regulator [Propionibacteriaceae bacterium]